MLILLLINLIITYNTYGLTFSLDSTLKNNRYKLSFTINTRSKFSLYPFSYEFGNQLNNSETYHYPKFFSPNKTINHQKNDSKLFGHQKYVFVHSDNPSVSFNHYTNLFSDSFSSISTESSEYDYEDSFDQQEYGDDSSILPNNERFFDQFVKKFEHYKNDDSLHWMHPMPCCISQMAAFSCVNELMPKSHVPQCFKIDDDTKLDDLISTKLGPYYTTSSYDMFFKYQKCFYFDIDKGEVVKSKIQPLKVETPEESPELEANKSAPTVPLGWRTFAVLGLFDSTDSKDDPSIYWCSKKLSDGEPPPRISSGLFRFGDSFNFMANRDAIQSDGSLLYSKDKIAPGELYTGEKGDMSTIISDPPDEFRTISKDLYKYRFSEEGIWPKIHFENVIGTLTHLQALWARLSTTMLKSTSKVIRLYKIKTRKMYTKEIFSVKNKQDVSDYFKNSKKEPVEFDLGVLYFMAAPTLHHGLQLVCSDPMARSDMYKNLLIFEVEDALKDKMMVPREQDLKNPREYLILGRYSGDYLTPILGDRMMRFLIRSNCVKSYFHLKSPRKDNYTDLNLPLQQILPFRQYLKSMLKDSRFRNQCLNTNSSPPIGDLSIITKFEFDEALDWAHRNPYTRAGCYDSLFVTMAHEVGFYNQNCKFVLPVPVTKKLIPHGQEYVTVNRDPLKILSDRMKQHSGHLLTIPHNISDFFKLTKKSVENTKKDLKKECDRLFITVRTTVSNKFDSENISKVFAKEVSKPTEYKIYKRGELSVLLPSDMGSTCKDKLCEVKSFPFVPYTDELLTKVLDENAPKELDKPFYAKFLSDYVYLTLPEGHFFEPKYEYDNRSFNAPGPCENDTSVGAEEMLLTDKYNIKPVTGFWVKKKDLYIFRNGDHILIVPNKKGGSHEMTEEELKAFLLKDEVYMDMIRRGGAAERVDTSNSYSRYDGKLICHLTPEEMMKTAFTVPPINNPCTKFSKEDHIPYCRFYEKGIPYDKDDPRYLMTFYPYELYQIQLDFMNKLDRGLVSINDDPVKTMVQSSFEQFPEGNKVYTWEEPEKNLIKEFNTFTIEEKEDEEDESTQIIPR